MRRPRRSEDFDAQVTRVAALGEPVRRLLYRYVVAQDEPVSRDGAAAGVGVARHVAKFHLDKLEADGLLEVEYSRPTGRGGPGAGRPAKLYRRAQREIEVSLPARQYDLVGRVMAEAITTAAGSAVPLARALQEAARSAGRGLGEQASHSGPDVDSAIVEVLTANGFEPRAGDAGITLANCPFHDLAQDYTDLVCGMNHDLVSGLVEGAGDAGLCARLDPAPGRCCVTLTRTDAPRT